MPFHSWGSLNSSHAGHPVDRNRNVPVRCGPYNTEETQAVMGLLPDT